VTISLPKTTALSVRKRSKQRGFNGVSSYIKYLIDQDEESISEKELLAIVRQARKDYRADRVLRARSLADLL